MQGARNAATGMYTKYMRIASTAQRRITSHLAAVFWQPSGMASSYIRRPPQQFLAQFMQQHRQRGERQGRGQCIDAIQQSAVPRQ